MGPGCVFLKLGKGVIQTKVCRMWHEPAIVCFSCHILSTWKFRSLLSNFHNLRFTIPVLCCSKNRYSIILIFSGDSVATILCKWGICSKLYYALTTNLYFDYQINLTCLVVPIMVFSKEFRALNTTIFVKCSRQTSTIRNKIVNSKVWKTIK